MKKRGSQIEMFISFVIFLGFLLFVYILLNSSTRSQTYDEETLKQVRDKLVLQLQDSLTTFSIQINTNTLTSQQTCLTIRNIVPKMTAQGVSPERLVVQNSSGGVLKHNYKNLDLNVFLDVPRTVRNFDGFLKFYSSGSISSSYCPESTTVCLWTICSSPCKIQGCRAVLESEYTFGEIKTIQAATFLGRIIGLATVYDSGYAQGNDYSYNALKSSLLLKEGTDFGFMFELSNGSIVQPTTMVSRIPKTAADVYSETQHLLYVDSNGETKLGFLTIKVW